MVRRPVTQKELSKREQSLIAKYGSAEALAEKRREWQAKSRKNYSGNGGLRALSPDRLKEVARMGGKARWVKYQEDMKRLGTLNEEAVDKDAA